MDLKQIELFFEIVHDFIHRQGYILNEKPSEIKLPFRRPQIDVKLDSQLLKYFNKIQFPNDKTTLADFMGKVLFFREIDGFTFRLQFLDENEKMLELRAIPNFIEVLNRERRQNKLDQIFGHDLSTSNEYLKTFEEQKSNSNK